MKALILAGGSRKGNYKMVYLVISYFTITVLSTTYATINPASSYVVTIPGLILLSLFVISVYIARYKVNIKFLLFSLFLSIIILIQTLLSTFIYGQEALLRSLLSLILLFACLFIFAPVFYRIIHLCDDNSLIKIIKFIFITLLGLGFIALFLQYEGILRGKNMLFIREPSHYAILITPLLIFVIKNSKFKFLYLLPSIILTLLIKNATLLVGIILAILVAYRINTRIFFSAILVFILIYNFSSFNHYFSYFIDRFTLNYKSDTAKVSVLVYLSGLERAYLSLLDSTFIGLGFNRLGFVGPKGYYQDILSNMGLGDLNLYDGGANSFKLISELGIVGIFILLIYLYYFVKSINIMKRASLRPYQILLYSYFLAYFIELFVRGVGYFSFNLPFVLSSIYMIISNRNSRNNKHLNIKNQYNHENSL
ncbi:MAG: hypothetical protein ACO2OY_10235 [Thermodesulfobacteriaceae bacterium]|jgi:hypothetical protein